MKHKNHLLRVLGIAFGLAAVVGSVIGQGILRSPSIVAEASGSGVVIIALWALGAGIALISAFPFAELGAALPRAGGPMAYVEKAFGKGAGVVAAFALLMMNVSAQAVIVFVLGEFLERLGVGGGSFGPGALGMGTLVIFCLVNATGTRVSGFAQILLSSLKGVVLLGLVLLLFSQPGATEIVATPAVERNGWLAFGTAMLVIIGTYNGWSDVVVYGEEIEDPGKTIPRALFGGIACVAVLYLLVNLALLYAMTPDQLAVSNFAAADAVGGVFGSRGDTVFTIFGVLSIGAIANLGLMTTSRIVFAMARGGMLPRRLENVSRLGAPVPAMLSVSLAIACFLASGTYLALSATSIALSQAIIVAVTLAVMVLRHKAPDMARPYRVPWYPWPVVLALVINSGLLVLFVIQDPLDALLGWVLVGLLSLGYVVAHRGKPVSPVPEVVAGET